MGKQLMAKRLWGIVRVWKKDTSGITKSEEMYQWHNVRVVKQSV